MKFIGKSAGATTLGAAMFAATLVGAAPAQAFPTNCSVWSIMEDGVAIGGATQCLSGSGKHRVGIHCTNGQDYYGPWKNTGTSSSRISRKECPAVPNVILDYRWLEQLG